MKNICILLFLITGSVYSQTITGHVLDENKLPMQGVSVYLDGTTIGTSTDENGKYNLSVGNSVNTILIIRFIGYETVMIADPFKENNLEVYLKPKATSLEEIVIAKDPFTREQKLTVFREQFLGKTKAGKRCRILNEDAVNFEYDFKTNTLKVSSEVPLEIENPYLGYRLEFEIHNCYVKFYKKSIKRSDVISAASLGTTKYTDWNLTDKTNKNRNALYKGSQMHFFKNLSENIWGAKDFLLFNGKYQDIPEHYFAVSQEGSFKHVKIIGKTSGSIFVGNTGSKFVCTFNLLFNKKKQSKVDFLVNEFFVDNYGNTTDTDKMQFGGDIGTKRVGDLLPMDFVPKI